MGGNKKYLVWNNKGGVGKTFLSYMLSVEYALSHPDEDVVVIDACPQTNVSEIILGGNGTGEENLNKLCNINRTIAGYIKERFDKSQRSRLGTEASYFVRVKDVNGKMPPNLYLLPGDMDLDICSRLIAHIGTSPVREAWKISRFLLKDLIESFEEQHTSEEKRKRVFFIDCNPSFANYTELAVLAANRVIVPCTADAASIRGIKNVFKLIYNVSIGGKELSDEFEDFHHDVAKNGLSLPSVHLFVQNRSRTNERDAAKAFKSHAEEICRLVSELKVNHKDIFTQEGNLPSPVVNVKDGNTLASIINHEGCPLGSLQPKRYTIYGRVTQANQEQIDALKVDLDNLVSYL